MVDIWTLGIAESINIDQLHHLFNPTFLICRCPPLRVSSRFASIRQPVARRNIPSHPQVNSILSSVTMTLNTSHYRVGYAVPSFVSMAAVDLIKNLLQFDPDKRLPLVGVLTHPWIFKHLTPEVMSRFYSVIYFSLYLFQIVILHFPHFTQIALFPGEKEIDQSRGVIRPFRHILPVKS